MNRMTFSEIDAPLRTDENYRNRVNREHHTGRTPLKDLQVNLVAQFPLDYLHLVDLGCTKKILKSKKIRQTLAENLRTT